MMKAPQTISAQTYPNNSSPSITSDMNLDATEVGVGSTSVATKETKLTNVGMTGQKRKQPAANKSILWSHFTKCNLPGTETWDKLFSICNYCKAKVLCKSEKNGTSSMWNHARRCEKHPLYEGRSDSKQSKLNVNNVTGAVQQHKYNRKRCDDRCIEMIIKDELPFNFVDKDGFKAFCREMEPQWPRMDRKAVARGVLERYHAEKLLLFRQLKANETRISITTDTWTSIQNVNYLVLTAHFIDSEWTLHKRIINFCPITSHKGEDIGRVVEQCLRQWEIIKVFTITVDNASANDVAVGYMKKRLRSYKSLMFGGNYLHLRCACHIINLVVKDGLKELEDGIAAIWGCAKYVRSSASRLDKFREFAVLDGMKANANVPLDVITRWNSTYLMLESALKYEGVFNRMGEEDGHFKNYFNEVDKKGKKRVGPPSSEDWRNAEAFCFFLKKFYEATLKLSAWKSITSNILFVEMITLQTGIEKQTQSTDFIMSKVATSMKTKFDKYWGSYESINKIIMIANVLDPRYKLQYAKVAMQTIKAPLTTIQSIQGNLKKVLLEMYEEYKGNDNDISYTSQQPTDFGDFDIGGADLDDLDEVSKHIAMQRMAEQNEGITNEVDQYLADRYVSLFTKDFKIHAWWKANEGVYPVLSKLAKDIFAMPCSTVASENAFSLGSRIVDPFRASLTPKMVEALVCTSDWLRSPIATFNVYKDPTADEMETYSMLEELQNDDVFNSGMDGTSTSISTQLS